MEEKALFGKPLDDLFSAINPKFRPVKEEALKEYVAKRGEEQVRQEFLRRLFYPGARFAKVAFTSGGKVFKKASLTDQAQGDKTYVDFLKDKAIVDTVSPPAKALVVARSKPFESWAAYDFHSKLSKAVFAQPLKDLPDPKKLVLRQKELTQLCLGFGVSVPANIYQQAVNTIIKNAIGRVFGEQAKYEDKEAKLSEKGQKMPHPMLSESGALYHPPGEECKLYLQDNYNCQPLDPQDPKHAEILKQVVDQEPRLVGYSLRPDDPIPFGVGASVPDRSRIPAQRLDHKSLWSRATKVKGKRLKLYGDAAVSGAILGVATDRDGNWVVYDLRGMLRQVRYRWFNRTLNRMEKDSKDTPVDYRSLTPNQLVEHFSNDGVLSLFPLRSNGKHFVTFCFKQGFCQGVADRVVEHTTSLKKLVKEQDCECPVVSIDLGQYQPMAARISTYTLAGEHESLAHRHTLTWSEISGRTGIDADALRAKYDADMAQLYQEAKLSLPPEVQADVDKRTGSAEARAKLESLLDLDLSHLEWDKMSGWTTQIYTEALKSGKWTHEELVELSQWGSKAPPKKGSSGSGFRPLAAT